MDESVSQMGLDIHRKFSKVTARDDRGKIVWRRRLEHGDRVRLRDDLARWPRDAPVVLEGTFGWGWMSDELKAAGLDPHLASSSKVAAWRRARGLPKSNRNDADLLSELWSERQRWWEVWLAPPEVRQQREWLRYRMTLVRTQTALKNRIHAILHRHGILHAQSDLFGRDGRRFLSLLVAAQPGGTDVPTYECLPDSARAMLKGYLQLLDHVRRQIAAVTRQFRKQVEASPAAQRLKSIPGIAWILGYTILAEIGRIERFASAKHLASYSLLAPRANDSGEEDDEPPKGRHVGLIGRRTLKWAFIEAAHGAVRKGGRFRAIFDRRTNGGKRDKNRGYIAVAHELCRLSYVCWKKQVDYTAEPPLRPGRRRRGGRKARCSAVATIASAKQTSRPELGQPDRPMVVAAE
ncbi:MAG: IS110 family transposase [bacterium]|nr:IS110 family transposase [bacterium]